MILEVIDEVISRIPESYSISIRLGGEDPGVEVEYQEGLISAQIWETINTGNLEVDLYTALQNIEENEEIYNTK